MSQYDLIVMPIGLRDRSMNERKKERKKEKERREKARSTTTTVQFEFGFGSEIDGAQLIFSKCEFSSGVKVF